MRALIDPLAPSFVDIAKNSRANCCAFTLLGWLGGMLSRGVRAGSTRGEYARGVRADKFLAGKRVINFPLQVALMPTTSRVYSQDK